jgi:GTP pyrophosphokinase
MTERDLKEWATQYRSELPDYESCTAKLESLIRDLLGSAGIEVVAIEGRAKHPESLERKVDAKRESYETPLEDVTDLIGVRVISYYLEDVTRISQIIEREFVIDEENSSDKLEDLGDNGFGYRSVHFVVALADQRANLAEWASFNGKKAEIQVRTATQHAWAAVEHKLNYKRTAEAPRDLRRKLMRLSALFELADEQFSAVKDELGQVEARYSSDVKGGNLDLPIDTASLEAFIDASSVVEKLVKESIEHGLGFGSSEDEGYRETYERDLSDLSLILEYLEVPTLAEVEFILEAHSADEGKVQRLVEALSVLLDSWRSVADLLTVFLGVYEGVRIEIFQVIYNDSICEVIDSLIDEFWPQESEQ